MADKDLEERTFVNTPMGPELVRKLDEMVEDHGSTRAQFIRLLVNQRYDEFTHVKGIKQRVETRVREIARK